MYSIDLYQYSRARVDDFQRNVQREQLAATTRHWRQVSRYLPAKRHTCSRSPTNT